MLEQLRVAFGISRPERDAAHAVARELIARLGSAGADLAAPPDAFAGFYIFEPELPKPSPVVFPEAFNGFKPAPRTWESPMPEIPAFMPVVLRWKPVGERRASRLDSAFCMLEVNHALTARRLRRALGEGCVLSAEEGGPLRILARTDARGRLLTLPKGSPLALDPLNLENLTPLLCPLGSLIKLWWTKSAQIFQDVRDAPEARPASSQIALVFDEAVELPKAVDVMLLELPEGPEMRAMLQRPGAQAFPAQLLTLAEDGRTWCVDLVDHALELAVEALSIVSEIDGLRRDHHLASHQLLLGQVLDILHRRGPGAESLVKKTIFQHQRLAGGDYRALRDDFRLILARGERELSAAGKVLMAVQEAAYYELSLHAYPEGEFDQRGAGMVSQKWAAKNMLEAGARYLQDALFERLYGEDDVSLEARLLQVAQGAIAPLPGDAAEQHVAQTAAVLAWLNKSKSYVQKGTDLAQKVSDPELLESVTKWIDRVVLTAAAKGNASTQRVVGAVTRGMRVAQIWAGKEADYEFELKPERVRLEGTIEPAYVRTLVAKSRERMKRFDRAGDVLKLLNAVALADGVMKPQGAEPSVLETMVDAHGFLDGLESTYRILTKTAETQFGLGIKLLGKGVSPLGVYLGVQDVWGHFQAGNAVAGLLATGGVGLEVLSVSIGLAKASSHPLVSAALALAGVVMAAGSVYAYDDDEKFLEQYRPRRENSGAYLEARNAVSGVTRALDRAEWANERNSGLSAKLAALALQ